MADATTPSAGTELAVFDPRNSAFPALFAQDGEGSVAQIIEDNFGDEGFDATTLDRLTVPSGGSSTYWSVPDEPPAESVEGIVVHKQPTRSMWFAKRGEGGEEDGPPDCASDDAQVGIGVFGPGSDANPTGECATCPMNVFGSSDTGSGNGKKCKEQMQLFILGDGAVLPTQVTLPPTSLQGWKKYMARLSSKGLSYYGVVTRLKLKIEKGGGQTYSVVVPERAAVLDKAEAQAARTYGATIRAFFSVAQERRAEQRKAALAGDTTPLEDVKAS